MATQGVLEALRAKQEAEGWSLRRLAGELGVTQPFLSMLFVGRRRLTRDVGERIEGFLRPKPSATLTVTLEAFIRKGSHKSPKTEESLRNRLVPFTVYLTAQGVEDPCGITREHVDGFLAEIGKGRRGKPLSPSSLYDFAKDVKAFVNHIADSVAPEDWRNPVRKLRLSQPRTSIHPLSQSQIDVLLGLADSYSPAEVLKARNWAMLYVLLDGALRISELLTATRYHLGEDGILRVMGKGGKEREVALSEKTLQAIADYMRLRADTSPYLVVTEHGTPLTYDGVKSLFQRWRKAAPDAFRGVRLSPHTLRHTSATMRRIAGMSEGDLQTFLGHSTPAMTRHYSAFALARAANTAARRTSPIETLAESSQ